MPARERLPSICLFKHNEQSLRIVNKLEKGTGINLTYEVRDGILNHKRNMRPCTFEGCAVNMADRIAYINHDIDDSIKAGVISVADLPAHCYQGAWGFARHENQYNDYRHC